MPKVLISEFLEFESTDLIYSSSLQSIPSTVGSNRNLNDYSIEPHLMPLSTKAPHKDGYE